MATRSPIINVMIKAADRAARGLKRDFGEVEQLQVSPKGPGDFVSTADLKAERAVREELVKARPTYGFLMEESGASPGTDGQHRWIVDPLDGTKLNERFGSGDVVEKVQLEEKDYQNLFQAGDEYTFMDSETFEQITLNEEAIGEAHEFLQ
jgi:hypothetical protein